MCLTNLNGPDPFRDPMSLAVWIIPWSMTVSGLDHGAVHGQGGNERAGGEFGDHFRGVVVHGPGVAAFVVKTDLNVARRWPVFQYLELVWRHDALEHEDHVVGGHRDPVPPLRVVNQMEGVSHAVIGQFPTGAKVAADVAYIAGLRVELHQLVKQGSESPV